MKINYMILALFLSINAHATIIDVTVTGHVTARPEVLAGTVEIGDEFTVVYSIDTELLPESLSGYFVNGAITKLIILNNGSAYEDTLPMQVSEIGVGNYGLPDSIHFNAAPTYFSFPIGDAYLRQVFLTAANTNIDTTHLRDTFYDSLLNADYNSFSIGVNLSDGLNVSGIALAIESSSISNPNPKPKLPEISVEGGYIKLDVTSGNLPPSEDCNDGKHNGRMVLDNVNGILYLCTESGWITK